MAVRQPIKSTVSAVRSKPVAKPHVGDGLEAILQSNPQLRRLFMQAKERGAVTFDQLNAALPQDFPPEQTEEVIQLLDAQGITVRNDDAGAEADADTDAVDAEPAAEGEPAAAEAAEGEEGVAPVEEELGRTDDPVRMYLREMGTIELLSREGEIEIAKRIEAGRNTVLEALCESPLTMRAVIGWRDAIREGRVLLRDIIDLDATNDTGPSPSAIAALATDAEAAESDTTDAEVAAVALAVATAVPPPAGGAAEPARVPASRPTVMTPTVKTPMRATARSRHRLPTCRKRTISTRTRCPCRRSRASCAMACSRRSTRSPRPIWACASCRRSGST